MTEKNLNTDSKKKPVTIITGFLGSGKTTLLKRILTENHGEKIAVIVNEFGEVGIDDKLIVEKNSDLIKLTNGCICCTMKNETATVLINLMESENEFDRVVIETTGLANPLPIMRNFLSEQFIKEHYELDGVITLVDALHIEQQLEKHIESKEQIAYSDAVIINKLDLAKEKNLDKIKTWISAVNPAAKIYSATRANVGVQELINISSKSKELNLPKTSSKHIEDAQISSFVLESELAIPKSKLLGWLNETLLLYSGDLLRYKGIFHIKDRESKFILQGVHTVFELTEDKPWQDNEEQKSQLIVIGRNLDKEIFEASFRELAK